MTLKIKIFFWTIITIPLISFGASNFTYSFSGDPRYKDKDYLGNDLIVTKKFEDGTQQNVYWRIRPEDLPITEDVCNEHTFDLCWKDEECFKPCLRYGPQFITYAQDVNKIYFTLDTTEVGATGIGSRLLFTGDLSKKQIKFLAVTDGFLETAYSPNKKYIVFSRSFELYIVNTFTDDIFIISGKLIRTQKYKEVHYLDTVHWISNDQFAYLDKSYGFGKHPTDILKNTYDINKHKIIANERVP